MTGEYKSDFTQNYGISLLIFDTSDKIKEVSESLTSIQCQG